MIDMMEANGDPAIGMKAKEYFEKRGYEISVTTWLHRRIFRSRKPEKWRCLY